MAVAQWHVGKLVILWLATAIALVLGINGGLDAIVGAAAIAGLVLTGVTWRWLSARERTSKPDHTSAVVPVGIAGMSQLIVRAIVDASAEERGAVRGLVESVPIDNRQLGREILGLKRCAAFLVIAGELSTSPQQAADLMGRIDIQIADSLGDPTVLRELDKRRFEYLAAMSVFKDNDALFRVTPGAEMLTYTEQPVTNAGKLFAFVCGAERDPIVMMVGATLFASTMQSVQAVLGPS